MEIKTTSENMIMLACTFFGVGAVTGLFGHKYYALKHTPEETIKELKDSREALRREQDFLDSKIRQNRDEAAQVRAEQRKLQSMKTDYQNEIKPEIEAKLRKELQTYISEAEKKYEQAKSELQKAKHEREIADLKLDLAKTLNESVTHTEKETKIIVKSLDEIEEELE